MAVKGGSMEKKIKKRGLRFYASIYRKIVAQDFKSKMSYRGTWIWSCSGVGRRNVQVAQNIRRVLFTFYLRYDGIS